MNKYLWFRITSFFSYWLGAKNLYQVHSPFVYDWYQQVLKGSPIPRGKEIDRLKKDLSRSSKEIVFRDLGAGSSGTKTQKLGRLISRAARKKASGELLGRMVQHYRPRRGLELGTHVGLSSLYCLAHHSFDEFFTLEGIEALAAIARQNFKKYEVHPTLLIGPFDQLFDNSLDVKILAPDFVFIDGNHQYQPTLQYFHHILPHVPDEGIIIFDDIYWSPEMKRAWTEIKSHPEVSVSIDLYFLGICFIRRKQAKEHFSFRFWDH